MDVTFFLILIFYFFLILKSLILIFKDCFPTSQCGFVQDLGLRCFMAHSHCLPEGTPEENKLYKG